jgi:hypothetical protein
MQPKLSDREKNLLAAGLSQWDGPAAMTDEIAAAIGFDSASAFDGERQAIESQIEHGNLSPLNAKRALAATEIAFVSDVLGAGVEWETVTGLSDMETLGGLRGLQRKLIAFYNTHAGD